MKIVRFQAVVACSFALHLLMGYAVDITSNSKPIPFNKTEFESVIKQVNSIQMQHTRVIEQLRESEGAQKLTSIVRQAVISGHLSVVCEQLATLPVDGTAWQVIVRFIDSTEGESLLKERKVEAYTMLFLSVSRELEQRLIYVASRSRSWLGPDDIIYYLSKQLASALGDNPEANHFRQDLTSEGVEKSRVWLRSMLQKHFKEGAPDMKVEISKALELLDASPIPDAQPKR